MSLVLAADYRVPDFDRWWNRLRGDLPRLPGLGAHHVVVYRAIRDPNHVFVTIGVREREPVDALLRSPLLFAWFDSAGVTEIPPLFAGQIVEKIDLPAAPAPAVPPTLVASAPQATPGPGALTPQATPVPAAPTPVSDPGGVVVASIVSVGEIDQLRASVHHAVARITASGVRRFWIYRALDDGAEVMILQELATERQADQWIRHPDASARFMAEAGVGAHPPNFVGRLVETLEVPAAPLARD
jgi:heme-degrading monooxygenase HmoA